MQKSWVYILQPVKFVFFLDVFLLAVSWLGALTQEEGHRSPGGLGDVIQMIGLITTIGLSMSAHRYLKNIGLNFYLVFFLDLLIFVVLGSLAVWLAFLVVWEGW